MPDEQPADEQRDGALLLLMQLFEWYAPLSLERVVREAVEGDDDSARAAILDGIAVVEEQADTGSVDATLLRFARTLFIASDEDCG